MTNPAPVMDPPPEADAGRPVVSVCIANWNCAPLLRACLRSLHGRPQGVRFETIVVDNASADGAADMVAREFPQVTLVRNPANVGFSRASNQAAALARGRYLFFLNNDTVVPPGTLGRLAAFAAAHPEAGMIGPRLVGRDGAAQVSYRRRPTLPALLHRVSLLRWTGLFRRAYRGYRRAGFDPAGVKPVEALLGAAVLLPRPAFEAAGRWDERYRFGGEDLDLSTQVGRVKSVVFVGDVPVTHLGRAASRTNIAFAAPNVAVGYVHYFRKAGCGPALLLVYKLLVTLDAPVQLAGKLLQAGLRHLHGRPDKAARSRLAARGLWHFLRHDLGRFWRA